MTLSLRRKHPITAANTPAASSLARWFSELSARGAFGWLAGACFSAASLFGGAQFASAAEPALLPQIVAPASQLQWRAPQRTTQPGAQQAAPAMLPSLTFAPSTNSSPQVVHPTLASPAATSTARIRLVGGEEPIENESEVLRPIAHLAPIRPIADTHEEPHGVVHDEPQGAPMLVPPMRTPAPRVAPPAGQPTPAAPLELPPSAAPRLSAPTLAPPDETPLAPPAAPMPLDPEPLPPRAAPGAEAPLPAEEPMALPGLRPAPAAPLDQAAPKKPCLTQYNGRDVCDEDGQCLRTWQELRARTIRDISLDLTAPFDPTARTQEEANLKRDARLAKTARRFWYDAQGKPIATGIGLDGRPTNEGTFVEELGGQVTIHGPAEDVTVPFASLGRDEQFFINGRPWKNRRGQVLAQGRLVDFVDGEVHVKQADGSVVGIPYRGLGSDEVAYVASYWILPLDCRFSDENYQEVPLDEFRRFEHCLTFTWKASALCHKPLWFEDVNLERYGHTRGPIVQPLASCAHFFGNILLLPYNMGMDPPGECQYALGYYRPGRCAPWMINAFPLSPRGALSEGAVVTGIGFIVP